MPRRLLFAALAAAIFACLLTAGPAFADTFTPESGGSQNANDIDTLYKLTLYIGIVIFLLVWGVLAWSLIKYRARRDGVAHQIRGNTPLEIGWTIGAASRGCAGAWCRAGARPARPAAPPSTPRPQAYGGLCLSPLMAR